jgi:hypothetical protein
VGEEALSEKDKKKKIPHRFAFRNDTPEESAISYSPPAVLSSQTQTSSHANNISNLQIDLHRLKPALLDGAGRAFSLNDRKKRPTRMR